jgi:hypothetical protein
MKQQTQFYKPLQNQNLGMNAELKNLAERELS